MKEFILNKKSPLFLSFLIAISFFIFNYKLISDGHFTEDAYILFIYVENFINGHGITFYPGGPHIEGATDFLWLIFLSILGKLGFDSGTSVIILNSIGVFIISFLINNEILRTKFNYQWLFIIFYPFIFLWLSQPPLYAAIGGFSVYLYMSFVLLAFVSIQNEKYLIYTPYISLLLALFRPDGVILGLGFAILGLYLAYKKNIVKYYIYGLVFGFIIGSLYFIWRYNYFGNLLPLPLYVKGHGSLTSGLGTNLMWVKNNLYLLLPIFAMLMISLNRSIRHYLFLSTPVVLLFLALLTATQSQNVDFRFQAPIYIVAYYVFLLSCIKMFQQYSKNKIIIVILTFVLLLFFAHYGDKGIKHINRASGITNFNYTSQVALAINKIIPEGATIALTEAGQMAYWNQSGNHQIVDLVGLNSEYPAKNTISIKYIEELSSDIMMYHIDGRMSTKWLVKSNKKVILLSNKDKSFFTNTRKYSQKQRQSIQKVSLASIVATEYLQKHFNDYDIFIVDYIENKSYSYVYAFKKSLNLRSEINTLLENSFQKDTALSYYEMLDKLKTNNLE